MIHLITGGSGSGKSAYAEDWLLAHKGDGDCIYIATMEPYGEEGRRRIARHRALRAGKGFLTRECYRDLEGLEISPNGGILLECMSNLAANECYGKDGTQKGIRETKAKLLEGIRYLERHTGRLVVVTNEVCSDLCRYSAETETYRRLLGGVNQKLAEMAHRVTEVVYGIPVEIKRDEKIVE